MTAHSATLSLNFVRASSGASPLAPGDVAAAAAAGNWNHATQANANAGATGIALSDDSGVVTTATARSVRSR